jgi:hypothetical protein
VSNIAGSFINGQLIIGQTSNARYSLATFDPLANPSNKENYDNEYVANSYSVIVDTTENNPFGSI